MAGIPTRRPSTAERRLTSMDRSKTARSTVSNCPDPRTPGVQHHDVELAPGALGQRDCPDSARAGPALSSMSVTGRHLPFRRPPCTREPMESAVGTPVSTRAAIGTRTSRCEAAIPGLASIQPWSMRCQTDCPSQRGEWKPFRAPSVSRRIYPRPAPFRTVT